MNVGGRPPRAEERRTRCAPRLKKGQIPEAAPGRPGARLLRFPPEIISRAVWLYHRFGLSFPDAEDLLAQRGVTVT
jgi:hypothetical protein